MNSPLGVSPDKRKQGTTRGKENIINILVFRPFQLQQKEKTNSGYKHNSKHNIKWDHFEILASGQCDLQCKIKETLLKRDLKPALNGNVDSENLLLY